MMIGVLWHDPTGKYSTNKVHLDLIGFIYCALTTGIQEQPTATLTALHFVFLLFSLKMFIIVYIFAWVKGKVHS